MTRKPLLTLDSLQMLRHPFLLANALRVVRRPTTNPLHHSKSTKMLEMKTWSPKRCSRTHSTMWRTRQRMPSPNLRVEDQRPRFLQQRSDSTSRLQSKHPLNRGLRRTSKTPSLRNMLHLQPRSQCNYRHPKPRGAAMLSRRRFPSHPDTNTSLDPSHSLPKHLEHHPPPPMHQPFTTLLANCLLGAPIRGA